MDEYRRTIGASLRELRKGRQWTQVELAQRLELSQGYLSMIERGEGSLTAEQFVEALGLFNVSAARFVGQEHQDRHEELQNALARHGATHLRVSEEVVSSDRYEDVGDAIQAALAVGDARLVAAIAPVVVNSADRLNLKKIDLDLARSGLERRLSWAADSTREAIASELSASPPREWARDCRRAALVIDTYLNTLPPERQEQAHSDLLDPNIRSARGASRVHAKASDVAKRWGIVTSIQTQDFAEALRAARAG